MYELINKYEFMNKFREFDGRYDQMGGYEGLSALFDYLKEFETDTGKEIELDVIGLCCEFSYYDNIEDVIANYNEIKDLDDLRDHTIVIKTDGEGLILQDF